MRKVLFLAIAILLFCVPVALAYDWVVSDVRVEVNGQRESNADETGGDIEVKPGDLVHFRVTVENLNSTFDLENTEVRIVVKDLDDGSDVKERSDKVDIDSNDEDDLLIDLTIPTTSDEDDYKVDMEIRALKSNGTLENTSIRFDMTVDFGADTGQTITSVNNTFLQFKYELDKISAQLNTNSTYTNNQIIVLQQTIDSINKDLKDVLNKESVCPTDLATEKGKVNALQEEKSSCVTLRNQCDADLQVCRNTQGHSQVDYENYGADQYTIGYKKGQNNVIFYVFIGVLIAGATYMWNKKRKEQKPFPLADRSNAPPGIRGH